MKRLSLVSLGLAVGVSAALFAACSSPGEGPTIEVRGDSWAAVPASVAAAGNSFSVKLENLGTESEQFAVIWLQEGDPGSLPVRNGVLDLRLDQPSADAQNPDRAIFYIVYPDYERVEGEGVEPAPVAPDTLEPGEEKTITIGNSFKGGGSAGTYVVVSYEPGGYETGKYAAFTVTEG